MHGSYPLSRILRQAADWVKAPFTLKIERRIYNRKRFAAIVLVFALCFSLSVSVFAAVSCKGFVSLKANQNNVTSGHYAGHNGQGGASNNAGSAGDVKLSLQISGGNGWTTYQTVSAAPGSYALTTVWGRETVDYLFRVYLESSTFWLIGHPGRIATGYVYTDG